MTPEIFSSGDSAIHQIDPRLRIVFALVYSVVMAVSNRPATLLSGFATAVLLVALARLSARQVVKRLYAVIAFIVLIWLMVPATFQGAPLFTVGPLSFSRPGIRLAAEISIKSIGILLALMALLATMSIATLGHSLRCIGIPNKLAHLLLITYRYVFVIEHEYLRLIRAMQIRGFQPKSNIHSYRSYAYLIGMLFVRASARADRVSQAMKCRGFNGKLYSLWTIRPDKRNRYFAVLMTITLTCLVIVELWNKIN